MTEHLTEQEATTGPGEKSWETGIYKNVLLTAFIYQDEFTYSIPMTSFSSWCVSEK